MSPITLILPYITLYMSSLAITAQSAFGLGQVMYADSDQGLLNQRLDRNGGFPKLGVPFWGSKNEDCSLLVYTGVPLFWETTE